MTTPRQRLRAQLHRQIRQQRPPDKATAPGQGPSRSTGGRATSQSVAPAAEAASRLESALALARDGWAVFPIWGVLADLKCACGDPCRKGTPGKHPRCWHGHNDATTEEAQIQRWWSPPEPGDPNAWQCSPDSNIGIAIPDDTLIVDVDPRNGGDATHDALTTEHGDGWTKTRTVWSGGGGWQFYFRVPPGLAFPKTHGDGIDLKQFGGYVLAPPSAHKSGGTYEWDDASVPIADAPEWLTALSKPRGQTAARSDAQLDTLPEPRDDAQAIDTRKRICTPLVSYFETAGVRFHLCGFIGGACFNARLPAEEADAIVSALLSEAADACDVDNGRRWALGSYALRNAGEAKGFAGIAELTSKITADQFTSRLAAYAREFQEQDSTPANKAANETEAPSEAAWTDESTIANVATVLKCHPEWRGVLGYNEFACRVLALREPPMRETDRPSVPCVGEWTDAHTSRVRAWMAGLGFEPGKDATDSAVEIVARGQTFHPVREYLAGLTWDGTKRLDRLLVTYFGARPSPYVALVGAKFMISAVARVREPGCKVDTMLILEGPQGIFKSTAAKVLAGDEWFADTALDFESKDAAQCLQGKWIYEIGELASFNRSEVTKIKAFVSSQADNLRPSYGRRNQDFPRQCVFIGTTNAKNYLGDTTGNRRYWPVACGAIDVEALRRDRDQLWAEAAARYGAGERWWLEGEEVALAMAEQAEREAEDPWEAKIEAWIAAGAAPVGQAGPTFLKRPRGPRTGFTMAEVLAGACQVETRDQSSALAQRAGQLLAKLGYAAKRARNPSDSAKFITTYRKEP